MFGFYNVTVFDICTILHELSFNLNMYEMSLRNVIKRTSGVLYNVSGTSFVKVYIKMTTSARSFLSHLFNALELGAALATFSTGFLHVATRVKLD